MQKSYILAIDQGTSSTKTLVFDTKGNVLAKATEPLKTHYLEGGRVEQEPEEIYQNVLASVKKCLQSFQAAGHDITDIGSCGISNQRETFVIWDDQGKPLYNAVVWQCKRSIAICERLKAQGIEEQIKTKSGLIADPYFSGTKLMWLNENVEEIGKAIRSGKAYFGTVDTWLLYKLTNGQCYFTDHTNASRTLFFNLETLQWDQELVEAFGLTGINLPEIKSSAACYGESTFNGLFEQPLAITAMIGDSHAAAFGEGCFYPGTAKATLGTGCSVVMNTGSEAKTSANGMMTTICWSVPGRVDYALEGVIVTCGATIEWLKNELNLFENSHETEAMATSVPDNNGVYIIPAFSGLGAPYWDMNRKASIEGLTFDCSKAHIVRAALETIPYQIKDILEAMKNDAGLTIRDLMLNGGITSNKFVIDFLADLLDSNVVCSNLPDASALGAAYLAALGAGQFKDLNEIESLHSSKPPVNKGKYRHLTGRSYLGWKQAIRKGD